MKRILISLFVILSLMIPKLANAGFGGDGWVGTAETNLSMGDHFISNDGDDEGISIDNDGSVVISSGTEMQGDLNLTTGTVVLTDTVWEDLRVPLTTSKVGANTKPDFDETNIGYLFPDNDASEILYATAQIPHSYKLGTNIHSHVHWLQVSADTCAYVMDYMWTNQGESTTTFTTIHIDATPKFTYNNEAMHQASEFPEITGTGKTTSSLLVFRLYRATTDAITGDVLTWEIDFHYERNTMGSRTEWVK